MSDKRNWFVIILTSAAMIFCAPIIFYATLGVLGSLAQAYRFDMASPVSLICTGLLVLLFDVVWFILLVVGWPRNIVVKIVSTVTVLACSLSVLFLVIGLLMLGGLG